MEALNNPELIQSLELLPGSKRFKAMVLGLTALKTLKEEVKNGDSYRDE